MYFSKSLNTWVDNDDLFQALVTSCFIPFIIGSRFANVYQGNYCFDGGIALKGKKKPYECVDEAYKKKGKKKKKMVIYKYLHLF